MYLVVTSITWYVTFIASGFALPPNGILLRLYQQVQGVSSKSQCSAFQFLFPAQDSVRLAIFFAPEQGRKRSRLWQQPFTSPLRFYFPDNKSGFEQSNVLSKIRFITTGSILCTPPSYLPRVSTLTIYNDVLVSQYIGFYGSYALLGVPAPITSAIKPGDLPVAIFFLVTWILLRYPSSTHICQIQSRHRISNSDQLESKEPMPIGYRVGNRYLDDLPGRVLNPDPTISATTHVRQT